MEQKRDVADIIDAVLSEMPPHIVDEFQFIHKEAHSGFVPPECRMGILGAFTKKFNTVVPKPPTEPWHYRAVAKLLNTTEQCVREMFA